MLLHKNAQYIQKSNMNEFQMHYDFLTQEKIMKNYLKINPNKFQYKV